MSKYVVINGKAVKLEDAIAKNYSVKDSPILMDNKPIKDNLTEEQEKQLFAMDTVTEVIRDIRDDIRGEYDAIGQYEVHINYLLRAFADTKDIRFKQVADVLIGIKNEEIPHTGELNKCLTLFDDPDGKLFNKGVKEAKKTIASQEDNK